MRGVDMKSIHRLPAIACGLILITFLMLPAAADATLITASSTGTRTATGGGVTGAGTWLPSAGGFSISWNITLDGATNLYTYTYTLADEDGSSLDRGLSHWNLQVSDSFTSANIFAGSTPVASGDPKVYTSSGSSGDQPNQPGSLYSLKFEGDDATTNTLGGEVFTLVTDRAPVWGSFYAKDGNGDPITYAWNTGFTGNDGPDTTENPSFTRPNANTTNFNNWIATPDTTTTVVPEPSTLISGGLGVLLCIGYGLRRRKIAVE